ncbi:MAG: sensor histidine kinase [Myxococcales bacterium]
MMMEALAELVALVRCDGTIILTNRHWQREMERRGSSNFSAGGNYSGALATMAEAGDTRVVPILEAFNDITAGTRQSFRCVYFGSGIFSGHDYSVRLSAFDAGSTKYVLVTSHDVTEVNTLKRQRRRFGSGVLKAQESERRRIARELHDSTSQQLVLLQLHLMNLGEIPGASTNDLVSECKKVVKEIQSEIRSLSFISHPPPLSGKGLEVALKELTGGFAARTGLNVDLQISDLGGASASVEAAIYRLTQEALANIHRHASASRASVRVVGTKRFIHMVVSDDGIGVAPDEQRASKSIGVGIVGMKERVRELGGRFSMRRVEKGTVLSVSLPRVKPNA